MAMGWVPQVPMYVDGTRLYIVCLEKENSDLVASSLCLEYPPSSFRIEASDSIHFSNINLINSCL